MLSFAKALTHHIAQERQQEDMLTDADTIAAQATTHMPATGVLFKLGSECDTLENSGRSTWLPGRIGFFLTAGVHRLLEHAHAPARHGEALTEDDAFDRAIVPSMLEKPESETIERG